MEWIDLLKGALGSTPIAALLGFATWKLWLKLEVKDAETDRKLEAKDAEIARLNEMLTKTLIDVSRRSDES